MTMVLTNKAQLLFSDDQFDEALDSFQEVIEWREQALRAGQQQHLAGLMGDLRHRAIVYLKLSRWDEGARDIVRIFELTAVADPFNLPKEILNENLSTLHFLSELEPEAREAILGVLGLWEKPVRSILSMLGGEQS